MSTLSFFILGLCLFASGIALPILLKTPESKYYGTGLCLFGVALGLTVAGLNSSFNYQLDWLVAAAIAGFGGMVMLFLVTHASQPWSRQILFLLPGVVFAGFLVYARAHFSIGPLVMTDGQFQMNLPDPIKYFDVLLISAGVVPASLRIYEQLNGRTTQHLTARTFYSSIQILFIGTVQMHTVLSAHLLLYIDWTMVAASILLLFSTLNLFRDIRHHDKTS